MSAGAAEKQGVALMPPAETLAVEAIQRLIADGYLSSVMKLPRPTLNELGRRLVDPQLTVDDSVTWLDEDQGLPQPKSNVYRFAQRFREVYKAVWGQRASDLLMMERSAAGDFDLAGYQDVTRNRAATLIAQRLMTTDASELDLADIQRLTATLSAIDHGRVEAAKLQLAERQAEDRAAKLAAEVERLVAETAAKKARVEERLKAAEKRVDDLSKVAKNGGTIDPSVFAAIREELAGARGGAA